MAVPVQEFWKLAVRSRAISLDEAKTLHSSFTRTPGAAKNANSATVAEWLVSMGVLSRYQARQLLAGQPGPFVFGDYKVFDCVTQGPLAGLHRAVHASTGQPAMLFFCESNEGQDWATAQQQAEATIAARYPQAGRIFGMVDANSRRFLVLEDVTDRVAVAQAGTSVAAPQVSQTGPSSQPALRPIPARPIAVPKPGKANVAVNEPVFIQTKGTNSIPDSPIAYRRKRASTTPLLVGAGIAAISVIALASLLLMPPSDAEKKNPSVANASSNRRPRPLTPQPVQPPSVVPQPPPSRKPQTIEPVTPDNSGEVAAEVPDDGQTLWVSPTQGPPLDLRYLSGGAQMFLVIRPSSLLGKEEGERVFDALGPRAIAARDFVQGVTGVQFMDIERLLVAFYPNDGAPPQLSFVVTLRETASKEQLLQGWHNPGEAGKAKKFYQGGQWAYYIPPEANGRTFAILPPAMMTEMLAMDGPPILRKEMEKLLRDTDDTRHLTVLFAPNFLFTDGQAILSGDLSKLKSPLLAYLGEGILAASLSFHLVADSFFSEMRAWGTLDNNPYDLAEMYRSRLSEMPDAIEEYLSQLNPREYGRLVLTRMPRMISQLASFTRIGEENSQAVLRCYLPAAAAHNLTLATELALAENPGDAAVVVSAGPRKPANLAEALKQKITLSFPRNTLEKCMEMLGEEIGYPVHIEGKDLQLEGITKNQSFGLDERDKPADEILRKVMSLANPDGKLVYVLKPAETGGADVVFVTTRAAVAKRGDKLPAELEQAPPKK